MWNREGTLWFVQLENDVNLNLLYCLMQYYLLLHIIGPRCFRLVNYLFFCISMPKTFPGLFLTAMFSQCVQPTVFWRKWWVMYDFFGFFFCHRGRCCCSLLWW